jgi:hypothetical protein
MTINTDRLLTREHESMSKERPDGSVSPYTVELVLMDGSTQAFSRRGGEDAR